MRVLASQECWKRLQVAPDLPTTKRHLQRLAEVAVQQTGVQARPSSTSKPSFTSVWERDPTIQLRPATNKQGHKSADCWGNEQNKSKRPVNWKSSKSKNNNNNNNNKNINNNKNNNNSSNRCSVYMGAWTTKGFWRCPNYHWPGSFGLSFPEFSKPFNFYSDTIVSS